MDIDIIRLQKSVRASKKSGWVDDYMGEVIAHLCRVRVYRGISNGPGVDMEEHVSSTLMIAMEKTVRYLKMKGKFITQGMKPLQTMKYIHGLVGFSYLEHTKFVYGKGSRSVIKRDFDTISFDIGLHDRFNSSCPDFDIRIDFINDIERELSFVVAQGNKQQAFNM